MSDLALVPAALLIGGLIGWWLNNRHDRHTRRSS